VMRVWLWIFKNLVTSVGATNANEDVILGTEIRRNMAFTFTSIFASYQHIG